MDKESLTLKHKDKFEKFFIYDNTFTTYTAFSSSIIFQGSDQLPKLGWEMVTCCSELNMVDKPNTVEHNDLKNLHYLGQ